MAICPNCEKRVPDGAQFCGHCGKTTGFEPNYLPQSPLMQYRVPAQADEGEVNAAPKPNCDLSVAGFVLSVFCPFLCLVAMILSAVALGKKQLRKGLAIAGLVISLVEIVFAAAVCVLVFVLHVDVTQYIPFLKQM